MTTYLGSSSYEGPELITHRQRMASNGFVASDLADTAQLPIFDVQHVQLQFSVAADFVAAQVANDVLVLALSNGRILRIDLARPEDIDGMFVPSRMEERVRLIKAAAGGLSLKTSTSPRNHPR